MKFARRNIAAAAAAVFAALAAQPVIAQDEGSDGSQADQPKLSYVGVLGSYLDLDKQRVPTDGTGIGLLYGRQFGHGNWFWEAQLFTQNLETNKNDVPDHYRSGGGLDLVYALNERRTFTPFALLGIGGNYNDGIPDDDDKFDFFANAGLGLVTRPLGTYGFRFRAEARYIYDDFQGGQNDIRYSVGLELPLSPYEQPRALPPAPVAESTEVVKVETMADSDGDGVPDQFDKCPETPTGMPVDGIGCGLAQVITLTGVNFDFDKATLTPDSLKILDEVALKIKHFTSVPMSLEGHTDSKGSDSYNEMLSQLRADTVRDYLIKQGVPGDQLTAKGMGEGNPVADNGSEAGRALNRRVELHIAGQEAPTVPVDASGEMLPGTTEPTADAATAAPAPEEPAASADAAMPAESSEAVAEPAAETMAEPAEATEAAEPATMEEMSPTEEPAPAE